MKSDYPHFFRPPGSLGRDIRGGLLYAAGFSILALVIIGLAGLSTLIGQRRFSGWSQMPLGLPLVIVGYFLAGTAGGFTFWLLRPVRRWLIGWVLTGFIISALVYGSIGLIGVLSYYVGANILDLKSAAEGWNLIPIISLITGVVPGIPVGIYYWYKNR
jgi:hypothetical protein